MLIALCMMPLGFAVAFLIPLRDFFDASIKERERKRLKRQRSVRSAGKNANENVASGQRAPKTAARAATRSHF